MNFHLNEAIQVLERTPQPLEYFLSGLPDGRLNCNEEEESWNARKGVEHLIEADKSNWIPRREFILIEGESQPFLEFHRMSTYRMGRESIVR